MDAKALKRRHKARHHRRLSNQDLVNYVKRFYGGIILGRTRFIKETLSRLKEEDLCKEEDIAHRRALIAAYRFEEFIDSICMSLNIPQHDLLGKKKKEQRNIVIYLLKSIQALQTSK